MRCWKTGYSLLSYVGVLFSTPLTKFSTVLPFLGDMEAARSNAKGACGLNIAGMVICLSVVTIFLVMYLGQAMDEVDFDCTLTH